MKYLLIILLLLLSPSIYAADTKVSALADITSPVSGDDMYIVDDPDGTPASKKISISALLGVATDLEPGGALSANTVDSSELVDGSVDLSHMSSQSVDSDNIVNSTIVAADMADADHGDVSWTSNVASVEGVNPNSVALATDTTGNYVATIADAGNSTITVANSGTENAAITLDLTANGVDDTHIDFGTGANQVSAVDIPIALGGGSPTIDQMQEYFDNIGSSGFFLGGALSDGGSGTVDVAAGSGFIRTTNDDNAELQSFKWSASAGIAVADDTTQYVYVDDSGTISLNTNEFLEAPDKILIGVVTDEGAAIESVFQLGVRLEESVGQAGRFMRHVHGIVRNVRVGGLIFGQSGDANRDVTMTTGQLEWGRTSYTMSAFDTSGADTFTTYSANGQEDATASQWPNEQYDNAGTLTTMDNNKWANLFFWLEPNDKIIMVYGRAQFVSEAGAEAEAVPSSSLPTRITETGLLATRFTFQKSANTADIESAFDTLFANAAVSDHGSLAGLSDDDHTQYLLADGTRTLAGAWDMGSQNLTNVDIDSGTLDGITTLQMPSGDIGATGARITKGWFADLEVTNVIVGSITGNAATVSTITGLAPDTATTQATQASITTCVNLVTVGTVTSGNVDAVVSAATTSLAGKSELAIIAEVNTGTDTGRTITPDALAGSYAGTENIQFIVFNPTTAWSTGDGKIGFHVPPSMNGMDLIYIHAEATTAGTTGTSTCQIRNVTQAADMLSTLVSLDTTETGSDTAITPAVIDTDNDDVATNDFIKIDVDAIHTTPAKGLNITMSFRLP